MRISACALGGWLVQKVRETGNVVMKLPPNVVCNPGTLPSNAPDDQAVTQVYITKEFE
jgi:hypothetical protein